MELLTRRRFRPLTRVGCAINFSITQGWDEEGAREAFEERRGAASTLDTHFRQELHVSHGVPTWTPRHNSYFPLLRHLCVLLVCVSRRWRHPGATAW